MTEPHTDPQCEVAHGRAPASLDTRTLVAVFASPVADYLLRYASDVGYRPMLLEPDGDRAAAGSPAGVKVAAGFAELSDPRADVVVTDHHRPELGPVLRDILAGQAHWVGVMGSPRHPASHIPALTALGVSAADIARVHRPIGLNIGSKAPAEIAIATIAGLIAERNAAPGGFAFHT
jgi:xanthine/CO dehydrogenase XdhC/CoxF family maturation factor